MSRPPRRIVLVDGHPLYLQGLETLLSSVPGRLEVVGATSDPSLAVGLVRRSRPDLAVVDVEMRPPGGLDVVRAVGGRGGIRVLAVSSSPDPQLGVASLDAGAVAYVPKTASTTELSSLIRTVADGWTVLPREVAGRLVSVTRARAGRRVPELGEAELRLWRLLAEGASTATIAAEMLVSERTAKRLIAGLLRTLGVENRSQAAMLAGRAGILEPERVS